MLLSDQKKIIYEFDSYRLDPIERRLSRGEESLSLPPKAFETLVMLIENNGRLVEKEKLMERVWADSFVEEGNLKICVHTLRKAFNGSNFIETVPKKGYRFNADVRLIEKAPVELLVERHTISELTISATEIDGDEENISSKSFAGTSLQPKILFLTVLLAGFGLFGAFYFSNQTETNQKTFFANPLSDVKTIAVLPLKSLSVPPQDQELRVGMADSIVTKLSAVRQLAVRPISATIGYLDQNYDTADVGRELKVDSILEGSVQKEAGKLEIKLQMVSVVDGRVLWAESFTNDLSNVLSGQESVANRVSRLLALNINSGSDQNAARNQADVNTQALFLKGNYALATSIRKIENVLQAKDYLEQAIRADPNFAPAYANLALTYTLAASLQLYSPREAYPNAEKAARRALEIDSNSAAAHTALGEIESDYNWNWSAAEIEYKRAIELAPNLATAHHSYAEFLARMGRFEESAYHSDLARELDPTRINYEAVRGLHYFYEHRFDDTIAQSRMVIKKDLNAFLAYLYLSIALAAKGDFDEGIAAGNEANRISGGAIPAYFVLGCNYALEGDKPKTNEILAKLEFLNKQQYVDPFHFVVIYTYLGDKERAFEYLEKSYTEKSYWMTSIKVHPVVDSLRSDVRFTQMLKKMKLAD